jgi:hypothetical protein
MNKWIAIVLPIISILLMGVLVLGVVYFREANKLNDVQAEIVTMEGDISILESNISVLEVDLVDAKAVVLALEAELLVTFPDVVLEDVLRVALNKPEGNIYTFELKTLTVLEAFGIELFGGFEGGVAINPVMDGRVISDLNGLEYCVNLERLVLLEGSVSDISPLVGLIHLETLSLSDNTISDISPLAGLTNLSDLSFNNNNISDISALTGLTNLLGFYLSYNNVSDISALVGLTSLQEINLQGNNISDISPLVENSGLSAGDTVDLRDNPLSTTSIDVYIPQLEARGVAVEY